MPIIPTTFCGCIPLQSSLDAHFSKINTPGGRDTGSTGLLQFLASAENNRNRTKLEESLATSVGKKRPVTMMYDTPVCVKVCLKSGGCADPVTETTAGSTCVTYDIQDQYTTCDANGDDTALTFDAATFSQFCERNDGQYMQQRFAEFDFGYIKGLDKTMTTMVQTITNAQPAANRVAAFPIVLPPTATGFQAVNPMLISYINQKYRDSGMAGAEYIIIGGSMASILTDILKVSTASAEGFDSTKLAPGLPPIYFDKNFDATFGADTIVILPLGAIQLVNFVENKGSLKFMDDRLIKDFKLFNLGNGVRIPFDYKWKLDPECGLYSYQPYNYMELVKSVCGGCGVNANDCGIYTITNCTEITYTCPA